MGRGGLSYPHCTYWAAAHRPMLAHIRLVMPIGLVARFSLGLLLLTVPVTPENSGKRRAVAGDGVHGSGGGRHRRTA